LGISCAGTGLKDAIELLEPLTSDAVDFVRQGALIGLAMVLIQFTKAQEPKVEQVRKLFDDKIADKHEDVMCKFGAILAAGIIDAGGRNVTIALHSRSGHKNMNAIVGLALFTQFWYWYPLVHFISLALTPTTFIGLNKDLKMPVFKFKSKARPSLFAYPPPIPPPEKKEVGKVSTAVLSITKKKELRDKKKKKDDAMDIDSGSGSTTAASPKPDSPKEEIKDKKEQGEKKEGEKKEGEKKEEKPEEKKEPEPEFEIKTNPVRVTLPQVRWLSFDVDERYRPAREDEVFGIVMLRDTLPETPVEFVKEMAASTGGASPQSEEPEAEPPAAFDYDPTKE